MAPLILLLLVQAAPSLSVPGRYVLVDLYKSWSEAQTYCREKFKDLATVETQDDQTAVQELVKNSSKSYVWIGLYDDIMSWRWSADGSLLYEGGNTNLGSWFVFNKDNQGSREHCVAINGNALYDHNCELEKKFVCFDEANKQYVAMETPMTWLSAQSSCRGSNSDLASVRSQEEIDDIHSVADSTSEWWVGLSRETWKWSDGSSCGFRNWEGTEPNRGDEHCAVSGQSGWFDIACHSRFPFICSAQIQWSNVLKLTMKPSASVTLNDPGIQQAVLNQMEKLMREPGVDLLLTLSWRKQPHGNVFNNTETLV